MTTERQDREHTGRRSAREAIAATYAIFEDAFSRGDARTIAEVYTADAQWLMPGAPIVRGRAAVESAWAQLLGSGGNTVRVETLEVQEAGPSAYEVGRFTASAPDGTVVNAGKYIVIWQLQPDGTWKTHRDIANWDIAPRDAEKP
jgi:uncharacterized protein (TIGR02246 family)